MMLLLWLLLFCLLFCFSNKHDRRHDNLGSLGAYSKDNIEAQCWNCNCVVGILGAFLAFSNHDSLRVLQAYLQPRPIFTHP